jgi:hypothetical protein
MYGIKATTDLSFLRGKTLCQVCFGPSDLQLNFAEGKTRISVESTIGYGASDGTYEKRVIGKDPGTSEVLEDTGFLLRLLMKEVEEVHWTAEGTVTLTFAGGSKLQIYDDSQQFESYTIGNGDQLIVV